MVIISLPRSRYTKLPSGIQYEMLFLSDTNLALNPKFHNLMSYLHHLLFKSEAYIIDLIIGFYRTKAHETSMPNTGKFYSIIYMNTKIHYYIQNQNRTALCRQYPA